MEIKEIWTNCLMEIGSNISQASFNTWFGQTCIIKEEGGIFYIGVPNEFVKEWLKNHFHKLITKALAGVCENMRDVEYVIIKFTQEKNYLSQKNQITSNQLPLNDLYINPEDNLNSRYKFDSFVVGTFNELAYAASQAIIDNPGTKYNPFFVYGGSGLGKTHLIQAIGNAIKEKNIDRKVHYLTLEKLANDYVNLVRESRAFLFKEKYRKYNILIIDDIQFICKMEKIQEELFHLFNFFNQNNRQIIFSSDKHPNHIMDLTDRLRTRFASGMVVDIGIPEYEARLAILKTKASAQNIQLDDQILEYIASYIDSSIRDLEGSLNVTIGHYQLKKKISISEVKSLIKNNIKPKKNMSIQEVVKIVSEYYNLNNTAIYEKSRRREIVRARQVIMFLLRKDFDIPYVLIGKKIGGKDHTTVIHSYGKISEELQKDANLMQEIEQIRLMLK